MGAEPPARISLPASSLRCLPRINKPNTVDDNALAFFKIAPIPILKNVNLLIYREIN